MIKIKDLTVKNFMSVGNATQAMSFDRDDLTLVLGANLDLGGDDSGARNGTGKTTIVNALSYALYGQALTNIKRDNLINKTNGKNMLVTIEFEKDGQDYKIERGRKPNVMVLYKGNVALANEDNDSQGDSRETQAEIERLLDMSHDMFKHIVALNTYTEPFLSLRANDQRAIIEQLLGITLLSEKAEGLKELNKSVKDMISKEEYRVKAVADANKRVEEQIESLKRRERMWVSSGAAEVAKLAAGIERLGELDIDAEIAAHKEYKQYRERKAEHTSLSNALARSEKDLARDSTMVSKVEAEIALLADHKCHSCGQELHDEKHGELLEAKQALLTSLVAKITAHNSESEALSDKLSAVGVVGTEPTTFYDTLDEAYQHRSSIEQLQTQLANKEKEANPYHEQILEMQEKGIEPVNFDELNELVRLKEHQEFLLKLLTNKDSFIRKRIIDQNLSYLNVRLGQYLDRIGLPHTVVFQNDLTVDITELGRELDFDNLSRGERTRLILSLNFAFRDVWESLYQPINLLFVDELLDNGLDSVGVENSLAILKKMGRESNKSIWLVSHKDELTSRVNNILTVVKSNGFTEYSTEVETI